MKAIGLLQLGPNMNSEMMNKLSMSTTANLTLKTNARCHKKTNKLGKMTTSQPVNSQK